jgi:hypothetical protein
MLKYSCVYELKGFQRHKRQNQETGNEEDQITTNFSIPFMIVMDECYLQINWIVISNMQQHTFAIFFYYIMWYTIYTKVLQTSWRFVGMFALLPMSDLLNVPFFLLDCCLTLDDPFFIYYFKLFITNFFGWAKFIPVFFRLCFFWGPTMRRWTCKARSYWEELTPDDCYIDKFQIFTIYSFESFFN